jgi:hypothetical protein
MPDQDKSRRDTLVEDLPMQEAQAADIKGGTEVDLKTTESVGEVQISSFNFMKKCDKA